jgi:uncharacterized membrane protein YqiK
MEILIGTIFFIFVIVWAFRVEINTAKTNETLVRIEKLLNDEKKGKK